MSQIEFTSFYSNNAPKMLGAKDMKKLGLSSASRRPFTVEEDAKLLDIMTSLQIVNWEQVAAHFNGRSSRQCRERWLNYLNPSIRTGPWTEIEDDLLLEKVNELGRCWSSIGKFFNGRSENDIKNRWYSHLKYRTVEDNGKFKFVNDPSESLFPYRKTRKRVKVSPQQNAFIVLEQQRRKQIVRNIQIQVPQQHSQIQMLPGNAFLLNMQESQTSFPQHFIFPPQQFQQVQPQIPKSQSQPQFNQIPIQPRIQQQPQQQILQIQQNPQPQLHHQPKTTQPQTQQFHQSTQQLQKQNSFLPQPLVNNNDNLKSEELFLSNDEEIQSTEIPEIEFVDFWEPHLFEEATTPEFCPSSTNQQELIGYSLY